MCFNTGVINTGCPHLTSRALHDFRRALTMAALKWQRRRGKAEGVRSCINCTPNPAVRCVEGKMYFWRVSMQRGEDIGTEHMLFHTVELSYRGWNQPGTMAVPHLLGPSSHPWHPLWLQTCQHAVRPGILWAHARWKEISVLASKQYISHLFSAREIWGSAQGRELERNML